MNKKLILICVIALVLSVGAVSAVKLENKNFDDAFSIKLFYIKDNIAKIINFPNFKIFASLHLKESILLILKDPLVYSSNPV